MPISGPFAVDQLVRVLPWKLEILSLPDVPYRVLEVYKAPPDTGKFGPTDAIVVDTIRGPLVISPDEAIRVADAPAPVEPRGDADLFIGPGYFVTKDGGPVTFDMLIQYEGYVVDQVPEPARSALVALFRVLETKRAAAHAASYAIQNWIDAHKKE